MIVLRSMHGRVSRKSVADMSRTLESTDVIVDRFDTLESLEAGYTKQEEEEEATASPHSYLSMPSCKQFPSMKGVEPLSRVLEPVMVHSAYVPFLNQINSPKRLLANILVSCTRLNIWI